MIKLKKDSKENKRKINLFLLLLLFSVMFIAAGVSIAVFTYFGRGETTNVIKTGKIVFSYSDAEKVGNGINITDALPIPDSVGKSLSNSSEYFDFSVTATTTATDLAYEIVVNKEDTSTLSDENVKIYLTERQGSTEVETPITGGEITPTYASLAPTTNSSLVGKTIYYGTVNAGEIAYGKSFRLRMWIKDVDTDDYTEYNSKEYTVRVNVAAVSTN